MHQHFLNGCSPIFDKCLYLLINKAYSNTATNNNDDDDGDGGDDDNNNNADWLHVLPLPNCGLFLDNKAVPIAVALRLGATMCLSHDCQCGQTIDALGLHCFSCLKNSGKHTRHSILNDIVWRTVTRAKIQSIKEPLCLDNNLKRPDGASLIPWQRGKCVTWDVTVTDTYAKSYIAQRVEPMPPQNGPPRTKPTNIIIYFPITSSFHSLAK